MVVYRPEELELVPILQDGESMIDGHDLVRRLPHIVSGKEQFEYLWEKRDFLPEQWKVFGGVSVPDIPSHSIQTLFWGDGIHEQWYRKRYGFSSYIFHGFALRVVSSIV